MPTKPRIRIVLASILGCLVWFSPEAQPAGEQQLGRILDSHATSLRGVAVPKSETILSGDALATSDDGSALVEFKSGAKLKITENSSVRFLGDGDKVQAELLAGAVVSESAGKPTLVVTTAKYQFAPSQEGNCRFAVALSKQQETVAAAMEGNLLVRTRDSIGSYILLEGKYAAISASSVGVPSQEKVGGEPTPAGQAGTVTNAIPEEVLQRQGHGAEIPLKVNDGIDWEDVVQTLEDGRLRIALSVGYFLDIGSGSTVKIIKHDPKTLQTRIQLTLGRMRAQVVKLTQPGSSIKVETPTAITGEGGPDFIVEAEPDYTRAYCIAGTVSIQNIDAAVAGQVILHAGEFTEVVRGLSPAVPERATAILLQGKIDQTMVAPAAAGRPSPAQAGWHIGSLSEAESVGLLVGIAAGAAAGIAIPLATRGAPAAPVSPSAP